MRDITWQSPQERQQLTTELVGQSLDTAIARIQALNGVVRVAGGSTCPRDVPYRIDRMTLTVVAGRVVPPIRHG